MAVRRRRTVFTVRLWQGVLLSSLVVGSILLQQSGSLERERALANLKTRIVLVDAVGQVGRSSLAPVELPPGFGTRLAGTLGPSLGSVVTFMRFNITERGEAGVHAGTPARAVRVVAFETDGEVSFPLVQGRMPLDGRPEALVSQSEAILSPLGSTLAGRIGDVGFTPTVVGVLADDLAKDVLKSAWVVRADMSTGVGVTFRASQALITMTNPVIADEPARIERHVRAASGGAIVTISVVASIEDSLRLSAQSRAGLRAIAIASLALFGALTGASHLLSIRDQVGQFAVRLTLGYSIRSIRFEAAGEAYLPLLTGAAMGGLLASGAVAIVDEIPTMLFRESTSLLILVGASVLTLTLVSVWLSQLSVIRHDILVVELVQQR